MLLLLLVLMHPQHARCILLNHVQLEVCAVFQWLVRCSFVGTRQQRRCVRMIAALLSGAASVRGRLLRALRELILVACLEAHVQMVVVWVATEGGAALTLIQYLAHEDAVDTNTTLATEVHDARVRVAPLEEQMLVVLVDEVHLDLVHSLVDTFKHQMVPVR